MQSLEYGIKVLESGQKIDRRTFFSRSAQVASLAGLANIVEGCGLVPQIVYPSHVKCPPIASDYGSRTTPAGLNRTIGGSHNGIDIVESIGYPVIAAADGKIIIAGYEGVGGNRVILYHGKDIDGKHIYSGYGHMNELFVETNKTDEGKIKVNRGQKLGTIGRKGSALAATELPHLHFMVYWSPTDRVIYIDDQDFGRIVRFPDGKTIVDPHDYWLQDKASSQEKKILIHAFEGKGYPKLPIRFTYPVPCERRQS